MPIKEMTLANGERCFLVRVHARSKTDPGVRVQKQVSFIKTLSEARKIEAKLLREAERELVTKEGRSATWEELLEEFELYHRAEIDRGRGTTVKETLQDGVRAIRKWTPLWMKRTASEITEYDVRQVIDAMTDEGRSNNHIAKLKQLIGKVFNFGLSRRKIPGTTVNPATQVKMGRRREPVPDILNVHQIKHLLKHAQIHMADWFHVWLLALSTGMRNGELYALKWPDIDFDRRVIKVSRSYSTRHKREKSTKSGEWRDIPISDELLAGLKELKLKTGKAEYVLPRMWQWDQGMQAEVLRKFCLQIGIPSIRFHALRACFCTALLRNNVAPLLVMKICGWKDLKTMQHYVRLAGVDVTGATESLKFLTPAETMATVSNLFGTSK